MSDRSLPALADAHELQFVRCVGVPPAARVPLLVTTDRRVYNAPHLLYRLLVRCARILKCNAFHR